MCEIIRFPGVSFGRGVFASYLASVNFVCNDSEISNTTYPGLLPPSPRALPLIENAMEDVAHFLKLLLSRSRNRELPFVEKQFLGRVRIGLCGSSGRVPRAPDICRNDSAHSIPLQLTFIKGANRRVIDAKRKN